MFHEMYWNEFLKINIFNCHSTIDQSIPPSINRYMLAIDQSLLKQKLQELKRQELQVLKRQALYDCLCKLNSFLLM